MVRRDASGSGSASTDANGNYTSTALYAGVYSLHFLPPQPYLAEMYDNFRPGYGQTLITVTESLTRTEIDAALGRWYTVSGTIRGPGPLANVNVYAYRGADSSSSSSYYTGADGTYRLGPLNPGQDRLRFSRSYPYTDEWYRDATGYDRATLIDLTGDMPDLDVDLGVGGRVTGRVTGVGGSPISNVNVYVYPVGGSVSVASAWTNSYGVYATSPGLPSGSYQVRFAAPAGYLSEWYRDQASQGAASPVGVVAGETTVDVDAQLALITTPTGAITGTVTAADTGLPLSLWVYAYDQAGMSVRSAYASNGSYALSNLPAGPYRLYFGGSSPYVGVYFDGKPELSGADAVTVTAGITTTDVNQSIPRGGTITGTVTGSGGLPGVQVSGIRVAGGTPAISRVAYTGLDGAYRLEGLPAGGYLIEFLPPSPFVREWYPDALSSSAALTLTVAHGATIPNIDAVLATGSVIAGQITANDTGAPLPGAYANITATTGLFPQNYNYANMDGYYRTPGLPAGDYRVDFRAGPWADYTSQWYDGAPTPEGAAIVTLPGQTASINAALGRGGSISGRTYGLPSMAPQVGITVTIYDMTTGLPVKWGYGNQWGYYQISGLSAGPYKVLFAGKGFRDQWYGNADDPAAATTVQVSPPNDTSGVDVYLRPAANASLSATVQQLQGRGNAPSARWSVPLTVTLHVPGVLTPTYVFTPTADPSGQFTLTGVAPEFYDLKVKKARSLTNKKANVALGSGDNVVNLGKLLEGDANGDGRINSLDYAPLASAYFKSRGEPGFDPRADFNDDGKINS